MQHIVDQIVSGAINVIIVLFLIDLLIGLFLIDLLSITLLDFSIVGWFKNLFNRNKRKNSKDRKDE